MEFGALPPGSKRKPTFSIAQFTGPLSFQSLLLQNLSLQDKALQLQKCRESTKPRRSPPAASGQASLWVREIVRRTLADMRRARALRKSACRFLAARS